MNRISETDLITILTHTQEFQNEYFVKGSSILITGATGFIGKWLLKSLSYLNDTLNLNIKLYALSRHPEDFLEQFPDYKEKRCLTWIKGDIRTFKFPDINYNYIIHGATDSSARMNIEHPLLMSDVIIKGTRHLLDFAVECKAKRILFLSSGAVYGKQTEKIAGFKEDYQGAPNQLAIDTAYAESKRIAEFLCVTYARQYNISISIARCFAFVGPYLPLDTHFAIGNFINDGLNGRNITITGNGSPLRSYMYASDMAIWLLTILLKGNSDEAYNVGSDKTISIKDLATIVAGFFPGIKVNILNQLRATDRNQNYVPDTRKAKAQFHFGEGVSLNDAIYKTIQFYKSE
jgi:nucleoside-diphosphate-sugar epimerase